MSSRRKFSSCCFADAAFEKRTRINARRGVALEIDGVAVELVGAGAEEMVEADFVERGGRGVGGNVSADAVFDAVGAHDHGQRVPANQALDAALHFLIAREQGLETGGDGVDVRGVGGERKIDAADSSVRAEAFQDFTGDVGATGKEHGIQRFQPFLDFDVLDVVRSKCFLIHRSDRLPSSSRREHGELPAGVRGTRTIYKNTPS